MRLEIADLKKQVAQVLNDVSEMKFQLHRSIDPLDKMNEAFRRFSGRMVNSGFMDALGGVPRDPPQSNYRREYGEEKEQK